MLRQALLAATVSGVALLSAGAVSAQTAQTVPAAAEPTGVDDIVVTAQRRSENIRDVPFAVTALSTQTLQEVSAGGADILSLSGRVAQPAGGKLERPLCSALLYSRPGQCGL